MATIKVVHFKTRKYKDGTSPVYLRLTINRKIKYFSFPENYKCKANQWDKRNAKFNRKFPGCDTVNDRLNDYKEKVNRIDSELNKKSNGQGFTFDEFEAEFYKQNEKLLLLDYFDKVIDRLDKAGKIGNKQTYQDAKNQLAKSEIFNSDTEMEKVTLKQLNEFVEECQIKGHKDTTISVRMRTLRALFNKARKEENLESYPFEKFNWRQFNLETEKRAISKTDLLKIYNHQMEPTDPFFDSRNYFLFSYFCYGMNFMDLALLEPGNIINDDEETFLIYRRAKTKKTNKISLSDYALEILKYYINSNFGNKYIFPILSPQIHKTPMQIKTRIKTAIKKTNEDMRELAKNLGIKKHITTYVARHSFATILKKEKIETSIISEMMGHSDPSITQTYLDSFDNSTKTEAAKKLI